ncbi:MAG: glycosyltransferase family 2 protein [Desulfovibrio sp.]|uniref:glycosyltransferase family 2 protein n=1 Tax=Desulfovibrio sp. TaxID=885 RepID=UPI002A36F93A|nr:glycosyltransferase family 2 protein [Desulfovibrio sp.]MDY0260221.1 glycosyltransferase family 2 protein [Desulfovibrio sp.]
MREPFFTIITATYNAADTLPRLLDSLAGQTSSDFELIIQDGASTDDTVAIAESYRGKLPALSLASEPDSGIYDAWNKALARVQGEWVLFLGADDELAGATVLEQCHLFLSSLPETSLYAGGGVDLVGRDDAVVAHVPYIPAGAENLMRGGMPFPHPGLWHRRTLFTTRSFDTSLRIAADYDFVCHTWTSENGSNSIPIPITRMRRGGVSDSPQHVLRVRWENTRVAARYFSGIWTPSRCMGLLKGYLLWSVCKIVGPQNAPEVLDTLRRWRGLPSAWTGL